MKTLKEIIHSKLQARSCQRRNPSVAQLMQEANLLRPDGKPISKLRGEHVAKSKSKARIQTYRKFKQKSFETILGSGLDPCFRRALQAAR